LSSSLVKCGCRPALQGRRSKSVVLSFIVPAHDEEALIASTLRSIRSAADAVGQTYEVIVVDDASTDRTGAIAGAEGARVVRIEARQIAKARNAGAGAASGETLFFVDADTLITPAVVQSTLRAIDSGAVGGGAPARLDDASPGYAKLLMWLVAVISRPLSIAGGCCFFCTRAAFQQAGGFDERLFAGEEIWLSRALRRHGRVVILREPVVTSGRKIRTHSFFELLGTLLRISLGGPRALQNRSKLGVWYGPRRRDRHER
jgi:glycosyltransferase involved in cell wall biosynthesis